jgi:hypothetical protein
MLASSLAPEVEGPEDVGVKGELPLILKTFVVGSDERSPDTRKAPRLKDGNVTD